ncbi:MAG: exo-alpha-sialidase [Candidatus Methylacidiphilales bacterium]
MTAPRHIRPLADAFTAVYESPDPTQVFAYSPGIARHETGRGSRIVATMDLGGPGAGALAGNKMERGEMGWSWQGRVSTSDDGGRSWTHRADFPFMHARPFTAGPAVYVLGHAGDLQIIRSDDDGETWSRPVALTQGQTWHQAPANVHYANGCVYLVMERRTRKVTHGWPVRDFAPVLMRARTDADLTNPESWTFSTELGFYQALGDNNEAELNYFGVPFYAADPVRGISVAPGRECSAMGWLETNVVQITDPQHLWHDSTGRTFHLWMRAHTGGTGYACLAKATEQGDIPGTGSITVSLQTAPSGRTLLYIPCPGGQMKFHILQDPETQLYWLLSTQATDSMIRPERMPADRYNLLNNERQRLQLHFSRNMVDWCFAGLVCAGSTQKEARHYASMCFDHNDLLVLSRSGDQRAMSAHNGNLITFHRVHNFRDLVY